jgi:hypothetical protein
MWSAHVPATRPDELVRRLLLSYLQTISAIHWPGGDGLTEDDALSCYPNACRHGEVPDRAELCRRHAELADAIDVFFASQGWTPCSSARGME